MFRLRQQYRKIETRFGSSWLGRLPCEVGNLSRCRADQALYPIQSGSFVGRGPWLYATSPCNPEKISSKSPTRYKFYIYIEKLHKHTNTHLLWMRHQGLHDARRFPSPNRSPRSTATLLRRGLFAKLWVQLQGAKLSWWPKNQGLAKSPLWCCEKNIKVVGPKAPPGRNVQLALDSVDPSQLGLSSGCVTHLQFMADHKWPKYTTWPL